MVSIIRIGGQDGSEYTFITIHGLELRNAAGVTLPNFMGSIYLGSASTIEAVIIWKCLIDSNRMAAIYVAGNSTVGKSLTIDSCTIINNGEYGVLFNIPKPFVTAQISNNNINTNGWASLADSREVGNLQGTFGNCHIFNNDIYNAAPGTAKDDITSHEIYVATATAAVADIHDNIIHGSTNGDGIKCRYSANIYNNVIYGNHHSGIEPGQNVDTSAIYNIHNNISYVGLSGFPGVGISNASSGGAKVSAHIFNNSFYKDALTTAGNELSVGFSLDTLEIKNNIFWANDTRTSLNIVTQTGAVHVIDYNLYWRTDGGADGTDANRVHADPKFVNASSHDFHLQSTSPAINAGTNVGLPFNGSAPDMGAFETTTPFAFSGLHNVISSEKNNAGSLKISVMANPSKNGFTIITTSRSDRALNIILTDVLGRRLEKKANIPANGVLTFGSTLGKGIYFLELSQGQIKQSLKLIKE